MEHQKIINLLDSTQNEPSKSRTRNWVEMNDQSRGTYNASNQIKFKTSMIKSNLCNYNDAYIPFSRPITISGDREDDAAKLADERNKEVIFKICAPFTDCISEINNTQIDNAKDIDVLVPICNFIKYSDNYLKKSELLWQYYRDKPANTIQDSESFKNKIKITGNTSDDDNIKNVEIALPILKILK